MKNFLLFFLFLFSVGISAQSKRQNEVNGKESSVKKQQELVESTKNANNDSSTIADKNYREKNNYAPNVKAGPAIFYVEEDKPVDKPNWKKKKI